MDAAVVSVRHSGTAVSRTAVAADARAYGRKGTHIHMRTCRDAVIRGKSGDTARGRVCTLRSAEKI